MSNVRFSITANDRGPKLEAWRQALCEAFGPIEVGLNSTTDFSGFVRTHKRRELQFNEICYRGHTLERTAQNLAGFDQEYFTFSRPVSGPLLFEQDGRTVLVESGSLVLLNQTSPYRASTNACYHAYSISIPKKLLLQRAPQIGPFYRLETINRSPRGQLLAHFSQHLSEGIANWSETEIIALREQFLDLLILLMVNDSDAAVNPEACGIKAAHRERAMAYIKHNHCNPQLTPNMIAAGCGISTSYLHKVFHAADLRVEHYLFLQRLKTCRNLLRNPLHRHQSVQQIAYKSGFAHASHFSRLFKEKYGMSPSEFRSTADTDEPS